jgi:hypothetical protein
LHFENLTSCIHQTWYNIVKFGDFWKLLLLLKHFDQKHKILMLVSHKNFIIEYFNERNMSPNIIIWRPMVVKRSILYIICTLNVSNPFNLIIESMILIFFLKLVTKSCHAHSKNLLLEFKIEKSREVHCTLSNMSPFFA